MRSFWAAVFPTYPLPVHRTLQDQGRKGLQRQSLAEEFLIHCTRHFIGNLFIIFFSCSFLRLTERLHSVLADTAFYDYRFFNFVFYIQD